MLVSINTSNIEVKTCTKCNVARNFSEFHKNKDGKFGLTSFCKACRSIAKPIVKHDYKTCSSCGDKKPIDCFGKKQMNSNNPKAKCTLCRNKYLAEYRKNNHDKRLKYNKEYDEKHKEEKSKYGKMYRQTMKGKAVSANAVYRRRSVFKNSALIPIGQIVELRVNAKVCYWCGIKLSGIKTHIDHYIPLSKGGEHTLSNLVIACSLCNKTKSAKDPIAFANSIGRLL